MTLNASGPLSMGGSTVGQSINLELGQSATALASINASNFRTLAGVPSGQISISSFYGKSNAIGLYSFSATSPSSYMVSCATLDASDNLYWFGATNTATYAGPAKYSSNAVAWSKTTDTFSDLYAPVGYIDPATGKSTSVGYASGSLGPASYNGVFRLWDSSGSVLGDKAWGYKYPISGNDLNYDYNTNVSNFARPSWDYIATFGYLFFNSVQGYYCYCTHQDVYITSYYYLPTLSIYSAVTGGLLTGPYVPGGLYTLGTPQYARPTISRDNWLFTCVKNTSSYNTQLLITQCYANNPSSTSDLIRIYNGYFDFEAHYAYLTSRTDVASDNTLYISCPGNWAGYGAALAVIKSGTTGTTQAWTSYVFFGSDSSGANTSNARPHCVTYDGSGNVYVVGNAYNGTTDRAYAFVWKYNSAGTLQWQRRLSITASTVTGLTGTGSIVATTVTYNATNSQLVVSLGSSLAAGPYNNTLGLVLRLPADGSKTGDITVPYPTNTALNYTVNYAASSATIQSVSSGSQSATFITNNGGINWNASFSPAYGSPSAPTNRTVTAVTGSF